MKNWRLCCLVIGLLCTPWQAEASMHRKACETPFQGVTVCWDAIGDEGVDLTTMNELHFLPIARQVAGQPEVWVDMSRAIFRQLLSGQLAGQLMPEWTPAYHLEGALALSQNSGWPWVLWIAPRDMRNSSPTSNGLVDWDVYLLTKGRLLRTLRIRVESVPNRKSDGLERATVMGAALVATGAITQSPLGSVGAVAGAYTMGESAPPESGQPLDLMTELATRQILFLLQQPLENLPGPRSEVGGNPWSATNVKDVLKHPFEAK